MQNARLDEAQAGIKTAGRNVNNLRYADDTTFMAESKEELKSFLMKVKEEWKSWLKAQHSENKDHGIVNKAEIDVFLELSCFFDDAADVGNLISGSSAFSKISLHIPAAPAAAKSL